MEQDGDGDAKRGPERRGPVQAGAQDQREIRARARQGDQMDETYGQKQAGEHGIPRYKDEAAAWGMEAGAGL